ncbi:hypothetical protein P7C73_g2534, partial [Tremellales sp. Uapishka_1]
MSMMDTGESLKTRIKSHYDGEHIHHGYFLAPTDSKEKAQRQLIELLLFQAQLPTSHQVPQESARFTILDVGCGIGGTSRYLARERGWDVTGITLSDVQVKMADTISRQAATSPSTGDDRVLINEGSVRYIQLDAEKLSPYFEPTSFDCVWISEALSHLPDKPGFFRNAYNVLRPSTVHQGEGTGRLVIADWVKSANLTAQQHAEDIVPIEKGMLLPPLASAEEYCRMASQTGFRLVGEPLDISDKVAKTWDISLSLLSPSLFALAFSLGTDVINFLKAFQAMRRGFANGSFRYTVLVFEKVE